MRLYSFAVCLSVAGASAGILTERGLVRARSLSREVEAEWLIELEGKRATQQPLITLAEDFYHDATRHSAKLEINSGQFFGFPYYSTNIALGTPNQAFRMILDIGFGGLLVRAPHCGEPMDCGHGFEYDSSASSTYTDAKERFMLHLPAQFAYGNVSLDDLHLISLGILNVTFGAVDDFYGENLWYYLLQEVADGAIGFGPSNSSAQLYTETKVPNILSKVLSEGILDREIMTLTLPYRPGEQGTLSLGELPEDVDEDFTRIPFGNSSTTSLADSWHVGIDRLSLAGDISLDIGLNDTYAVFELGLGFAFPRNVAEAVWDALDAKPDESFELAFINCTRWESMPDLVFSFGEREVVLSKEAYLVYAYEGDGSTICIVNIAVNWFDDTMFLGTTFMQQFHMVFDMEQDGLGLIDRERVK